ncbi:MAG: phosphatidate cytidylyltransferase, partial [Clostridiales bacterium]|nr:phosphatidate cytidylyltransferase [Clostridiales bacterium]
MDSGRKTRVIVGALLGLLFVGIVALGSIFRTVVFTVAAVIAVYEMSNMIYKKTEKNIFAAPAYVFAALCFPIAAAATKNAAAAVISLGALCLILVAAERIFNKLRTTEESIYSAFMLIYPMSLFGILALILPPEGLISPKNIGLLLVFICPLMGDMLAYYIGSSIGKRKLCPEISPHKTVEGCYGSFLGGLLGGFVCFLLQFIWGLRLPILPMLLVGIICGGVGQIGDLFASVIKRWAGAKDYGNIFPG